MTRSRAVLFAACAVLAVVLIGSWIRFGGGSNVLSALSSDQQSSRRAAVVPSASAVSDPAALHKSDASAKTSTSDVDSPKTIAYALAIDESLRIVGRTQNLAAQEYVLAHALRLCGAARFLRDHDAHPESIDLFDAGTRGARKLVPGSLLKANRMEIERITGRCRGFESQGILIEDMRRAAQTSGLPLANLLWEMPVTPGGQIDMAKARGAMERLLSAPDAADLFALAAMPLALQDSAGMSSDLPPAVDEYLRASRLGVAAVEIAACRSGAACGEGSLLRDRLCVAYLECGGGDVETAYRRLAERHGIAFDGIDRAAARVQLGFTRRDVEALIPSPKA